MRCACPDCGDKIVPGRDTKVTVTVTLNGVIDDRQSFCSMAHARDWCAKWVPDSPRIEEHLENGN